MLQSVIFYIFFWNGLLVELGDLSVYPETFVKHVKTHMFRIVFSDGTRTFEFVKQFVGCGIKCKTKNNNNYFCV